MTIEQLILDYERKLSSINSEIKELCSTHPDDLDLCKKLNTKSKSYVEFIIDLKKL